MSLSEFTKNPILIKKHADPHGVITCRLEVSKTLYHSQSSRWLTLYLFMSIFYRFKFLGLCSNLRGSTEKLVDLLIFQQFTLLFIDSGLGLGL